MKYNQQSSSQTSYNENTSDISTMNYGNTVAVNYNSSQGTSSILTKISMIIAGIALYNFGSKPKKRKAELTDAQKANAIGKNAVGELVYESPLVFVREKPVDPAKLQEEMRQKQFRIEYVEPPKPKNASVKKFKVNSKSEGISGSSSKVIGLKEFMGKKNIELRK